MDATTTTGQTPRSIVVRGRSLNDALTKACFLLHASREEITHTVLQAGSVGRSGLVGTPFKVRVSVGDVSAAGSGAVLPLGDPLDALFDADEPDSSEELTEEYLSTLTLGQFTDLLERLENEPTGSTDEDAAILSVDPAVDGSVIVEIAPSRMEAFLTLRPPCGGGRPASAADVQQALREANVRYGVDEQAIAAALAQGQQLAVERAKVAVGLPPRSGENAQVSYADTVTNQWTDQPRQNTAVNAGMVVARKIPPTEGAPGRTVCDDLVPALPGSDLSLTVMRGKNLIVTDDGLTLTATASGTLIARENRLHVESVQVIRDDLSARDSPIRYNGDVLVQGFVSRGVSITAGGDITIEGDVDVSVLQAGGRITIRGGVTGRGKGVLRAGGMIRCRFLEGAQVRAEGEIQVLDHVRESDVVSYQQVRIGGTVTGGIVYGVRGVQARDVEPGATGALLIAGVTKQACENIERIRERQHQIEERMATRSAEIAEIVADESGARRALAVSSTQERARLRQEADRLDRERARWSEDLQNPPPATIAVENRARAGVRVGIDETVVELSADTSFALFTRDTATDTVRLTSLK